MHYTKILILALELCNNGYVTGDPPTQCYQKLREAGEAARQVGMDQLPRYSIARQPEFMMWVTSERNLEKQDCAAVKADTDWFYQCKKGVKYAYERYYFVYLYALKGLQPMLNLKDRKRI
jgi:hypothetical protein